MTGVHSNVFTALVKYNATNNETEIEADGLFGVLEASKCPLGRMQLLKTFITTSSSFHSGKSLVLVCVSLCDVFYSQILTLMDC